ncbi:phage tail tube protein [Mariniblastus sp.]|nr:phage tail tube protein [Mariniblastus sp.]
MIGPAKHLITLLRRYFCLSGVPPTPPEYDYPLVSGTYEERSDYFKSHGFFGLLSEDHKFVREIRENIAPLDEIATAIDDVKKHSNPSVAPRFDYLFGKLREMGWAGGRGTREDFFTAEGSEKVYLTYTLKIIDSNFLDDMESALDEISVDSQQKIDLTEKESNICEALGTDTKTAAVISSDSGYKNNSDFRQVLSGMVKRGILIRPAGNNGYKLSGRVTDKS